MKYATSKLLPRNFQNIIFATYKMMALYDFSFQIFPGKKGGPNFRLVGNHANVGESDLMKIVKNS